MARSAQESISGSSLGSAFGRELSRRELLIAGGGLGLAALLAACSIGTKSQQSGPVQDKLTIGVATLGLQAVDPIFGATGALRPLRWALSEGLARYGTNNFEWVPNLATKWTVSPDALTWTMTLRQGVKMHDGSTFNARDVVTAFDRVRAQAGNPSVFSNNSGLVTAAPTVTALSDYVVQISFKAPQPTFFDIIPDPIPTDYYNRVGEAAFQKQPMGAGPFKFVSQQINNSVTYSRFDDFWDKSRFPNFHDLVYKIVPEESTRVAGIQAGTLDIVDSLSSAGIEQLRGDPSIGVVVGKNASYSFVSWMDWINHGDQSPFSDIRVRQALQLALDREAIAKSLLKDLAAVVPATRWLPGPGDPNLASVPYDPAKAKQLLAQAGFDRSFDLWAAVGLIGWDQAMATAVAGYWNAVGVKANLKVVDAGTYRTARISASITGVGLLAIPMVLFDLVFANNFAGYKKKGSDLNFPQDATMSAIGNQWIGATTPQAKADAVHAAQRYFHDNVLDLPIAHFGGGLAVGPHVSWSIPSGFPFAYAGPTWYMRTK